jgi:hypothetical protein
LSEARNNNTADMRTHAVMGIIVPEVAEARMAVRWPSVAAYPGVARLGAKLQETANALFRWTLDRPAPIAGLLMFITLPLAAALTVPAWLLLAPPYFLKILPFFMTRYVLTNRRLMIQKGWARKPVQEVKLEDLESVKVAAGSEQPFYLAADLEILSAGKTALTLRGVKEYEQFRIIIQDAYLAWGRKTPPKEQIHPATELAGKK